MGTQKCESPPGFDSSWERLPDEEWLPVEWSNGAYWVSNYSRVWSAPRTVCQRARGYLQRYKPYSDTYFQEVSDRYYEAIQKEREL